MSYLGLTLITPTRLPNLAILQSVSENIEDSAKKPRTCVWT
jgi:hypothetical protein